MGFEQPGVWLAMFLFLRGAPEDWNNAARATGYVIEI